MVALTPVDPLAVVTSPDLDAPGLAAERAIWVNPEALSQRLASWAIDWTSQADNETGSPYGP